ncbi:MAG TPA: hypothetical protein VGK48_22720 [Terriglobia bacterium]
MSAVIGFTAVGTSIPGERFMAESGEAGGKASDLYLGVVDLFAVILPGAMFSGVVWKVLSIRHKDLLESLAEPEVVPTWLVFLIVSYIVGHFLFALGSWLMDPLYDGYYKRKFEFEVKKELPSMRRRADRLFNELLTADLYSENDNRLTWSESLIRLGSASAKGELDRLEADSKFFRSLAVVAVLSLFVMFSPLTGWVDWWQWLVVAVVVLMFATLVRFMRKARKQKIDFDERVKLRLPKHPPTGPARHDLLPRLRWSDAEWLAAEASENKESQALFRRIAIFFPAAWTLLALRPRNTAVRDPRSAREARLTQPACRRGTGVIACHPDGDDGRASADNPGAGRPAFGNAGFNCFSCSAGRTGNGSRFSAAAVDGIGVGQRRCFQIGIRRGAARHSGGAGKVARGNDGGLLDNDGQ